MCNNRTAGERTAKQRFIISGACCNLQNITDPVDDFRGTYTPINIKEGEGIAITGDKTNINVGLKSIHPAPKTYNNPEQVTVNKFGQVTSVREGAPPPEFFYIFPDYPDVVVLSATSLSSIGANTHLWSGRWRTREPRLGAFKLSFTVNTSKTFVGLTTSSTMTGKYFLKSFIAGFYFESPTSFGVTDEAQKDTGLFPIGKWSNTDVFSIAFNGQQFIYYQNGRKIHVIHKGTHLPLYVAGAFHNKEKIIQIITNLTIQEIQCAPDSVDSVQSIMKCANGHPMSLCSTESVIVQAMLHARIKGNISAWANVDATGPLYLTLVIKGSQKETRTTLMSESGNAVTVFHGTPELYPPDTYTITVYGRSTHDDAASTCDGSIKESTCNGFTDSAYSESGCTPSETSSGVSIVSSRVMVMGHLL